MSDAAVDVADIAVHCNAADEREPQGWMKCSSAVPTLDGYRPHLVTLASCLLYLFRPNAKETNIMAQYVGKRLEQTPHLKAQKTWTTALTLAVDLGRQSRASFDQDSLR